MGAATTLSEHFSALKACSRKTRLLNLPGEVWHPPTSSPQLIVPYPACPNNSYSQTTDPLWVPEHKVKFVCMCLCSHTSRSF